MKKIKKCPLCGDKIVSEANNIGTHMEELHSDSIPRDMCGAQYFYHLLNKGKRRKCMECPKETTWNTATNKYNAFCSPECKAKYVKKVRGRMMGKYGKTNLLDDPNHQRKMLAGRKISGTYVWSNGVRKSHTGTYELDFLKMNDLLLNMDPNDIDSPSPHTYEYIYEGEKHFYIPDYFIHSLQLEIEIKDGGDNENMHGKIQAVDKVKEKLKDEVLVSQNQFNYIKIVNKEYAPYFDIIQTLKSDDFPEEDRKQKIKVVPDCGPK